MARDSGGLGENHELTEPEQRVEHTRPAADSVTDTSRDELTDPRESDQGTDAGYVLAGSVVSYEAVFEERKGKHWENYGTLTETREPAAAPERSDTPKETGRLDAWHAELRQPAEQHVTPDLKAFEDADLGRLEGLQHCFKGQERLAEKVEFLQAKDPELTDRQALNDVYDSLRYTMTLPDESYTGGVREVMGELFEKGYALDHSGFKNFWDGDTYKGINVQMRTPDGFPMELQFHTTTSFFVKEELTHDLYERWRDRNTGEDEKIWVDELQEDISSRIPVPDGALDLHYDLPQKEMP